MIRGPKSQDICYATENRQMAVKGVAQFCDLLLVVGSANSSNSKRLVEVGHNYGVQSFLVNDWSEVDPAWLEGVEERGRDGGRIGARASGGTDRVGLAGEGYGQLEEVEMIEEDVRFSLPPELAGAASQSTQHHAMTPTYQGACSHAPGQRGAADCGEGENRPRRPIFPFSAAPGRVLVRAAHGRYHARIGLHSAAALAAPAGRWCLESARSRARLSAPRSAFFRASCPTADSIFTSRVRAKSAPASKLISHSSWRAFRLRTIRV